MTQYPEDGAPGSPIDSTTWGAHQPGPFIARDRMASPPLRPPAQTVLATGHPGPGTPTGRLQTRRGQFLAGCLIGTAAFMVTSAVFGPLFAVFPPAAPVVMLLCVAVVGVTAAVTASRFRRPAMALGMIIGPVVMAIIGIALLVGLMVWAGPGQLS